MEPKPSIRLWPAPNKLAPRGSSQYGPGDTPPSGVLAALQAYEIAVARAASSALPVPDWKWVDLGMTKLRLLKEIGKLQNPG